MSLGTPFVPPVLNTSNCLVFGNTASGNALSVRQLGAGNCLSVSNALGTTSLFISSTSNVGIGTTNPLAALDISGVLNLSSLQISGVSGTGGQVVAATGVGSGLAWATTASSGTNQGVLLTLGTNLTTLTSFATSTDTPTLQAFHLPLNSFTQSINSVTLFAVTAQGLIKFGSTGVFQITLVLSMNAPVSRVALGTNTSSAFPSSTSAYTYVYTLPSGASPSTTITIPVNVTSTAPWYYLDVFTQSSSTAGTLYATNSASVTGSQYGTYIQVSPFGNYILTGGTQSAGLLVTPSATVTLSSPITSNTYHIKMTSGLNWTLQEMPPWLSIPREINTGVMAATEALERRE